MSIDHKPSIRAQAEWNAEAKKKSRWLEQLLVNLQFSCELVDCEVRVEMGLGGKTKSLICQMMFKIEIISKYLNMNKSGSNPEFQSTNSLLLH